MQDMILIDLINKHGEDDFTLRTVEMTEDDFREAVTGGERVIGKTTEVLSQLQIDDSESDNTIRFIAADRERVLIITSHISDEAANRYKDKGKSVRGSMNDIISEILSDMTAEGN